MRESGIIIRLTFRTRVEIRLLLVGTVKIILDSVETSGSSLVTLIVQLHAEHVANNRHKHQI